MLIWVALAAAGSLALMSARSVAFAVAHAIEIEVRPARTRPARHATASGLSRRESAMLLLEIALSLGIALTIVGLTAAAALPGRLLLGALLAQVAVLGALVAPPTTLRVGPARVNVPAVALGVAQLAHLAFFLTALTALW